MVRRTDVANAFEFVIMAGARARQLQKGCEPRVAATPEDKLVRLAQREVKEGKITRQAVPAAE